MNRVAVIILNWNGEGLLRRFLPSVLRYTPSELGKVIVADNCSSDGSLQLMEQEFPETEVMLFDKNYGFAGGYNRAIARVESEYVVLLNSDVEVAPGWLEPLIGMMDADIQIAAVQPKIKSYREKEKFEYAGACGGYIDRYGFPFCRGRILDITEKDRGQYDRPCEVFWCSGAALCIRRALYLQEGGLDEHFFAHMEEIDLCWRLRNRGYTLKVQPISVVYHLGGGSLPMNHPRKLFLNYRNNLLMLYKNTAPRTRRKILFSRVVFDSCAFFIFLLKGQWANACSVKKAYDSYRKMKREYQPMNPERKDPCIYARSIVWARMIKRIKTFEGLKWNNL